MVRFWCEILRASRMLCYNAAVVWGHDRDGSNGDDEF
jgi:hypothetical protein